MMNTPETNFSSSTSAASVPDALTYTGPKEVLLNQATVLNGAFDAKRIAKISLVAEDKYPLDVIVDSQKGTWKVTLEKGFTTPGARWLRLKGTDGTGKVINDEVVNITISTDPLTVGQSLSLKILQDTFFKTGAVDSASLKPEQKVLVKAGQVFTVSKYGFVDGHLKVVLIPAIASIGEFGYFYEEHVQLSKGSQILRFEFEDVPDTQLSAQLLITTTTFIKSKPADSSALATNQKTELFQGQTFNITGYAATTGHFRVTLAEGIPRFGNVGYIYWRHIQIRRDGKIIAFDPNALTMTVLKATVFKKRPVDSANLKDDEKVTLPLGRVYGIAGYALAEDHIKVALNEEFSGFGNTGYVYPNFVQFKRGARSFNPIPPQLELNVPYFSQRDNPRFYWSTCNVTSLAMVFYFYGVRGKGAQLEDELLQWVISRYGEGAQTDNNILTKLIQAYGFKTSFSTTRRWSEVKSELVNGRPVVIGGDFTASGHILVLIGYTPQGYIVNDPWGNALTGYSNTEGRKLVYSYSLMDQKSGPDGNIWAHFISR
jgi:uncharacterized protein YvpB